jgi:hypothetical protein
MRHIRLYLAPLALLFSACIPYAVGKTARPVPKGEFRPSLSAYFVPNGIENINETDGDTSLAYASADFEGRWGLSDTSDLGLRVPSASGVVIDYKRLLSGTNDPARPAVAFIVAGGIVNLANHAYAEAGIIASGREDTAIPYGGLRVMHVEPISAGAVSDSPTAGVFGGLRLRVGTNFSLSPELGVYYDESALGLRERNIIFIPSISFHWD